MKIPKIQRRYCPHCDKQTEHVVSQVKTGKTRKLSKGSRRSELFGLRNISFHDTCSKKVC